MRPCVLKSIILSLLVGLSASNNFYLSQFLIHKSLINTSVFEANALHERYGKDKDIETYQVIDIDLEVLVQVDDIKMILFSDTIVVDEKNKYVRGNLNFTWFGENNDFLSSVTISVLDDDIQGVITHDNELYTIATFEDKYILLKINQAEFNKLGCGTVSKNDDDDHSIDVQESEEDNEPIEQQKWGYVQKSNPIYRQSCKIRVLVMYTPAAQSKGGNMQNLAQQSIDKMNASFVNSGVIAEVELAHVQLTNYTETAVDVQDLVRFRNKNDGYMDEVHSLRNQYSADVCVLLCDIPISLGYVGQAWMKATSQYAFCVVDYAYSSANLTFAHEIGHLIGCQHNIEYGRSNDFYPYGYGYTQENGFRTIMGTQIIGKTNTGAEIYCYNCPRKPYWSGPNVSSPYGVTGNALTSDNVRVINENYDRMMTLRPTHNGLLYLHQGIVDVAIGDTIYDDSVITVGEVFVDAPQGLTIQASQEIVLDAIFETEYGSEFVAEIVPACGMSDRVRRTDYQSTDQADNNTRKNVFQTPDRKYVTNIDNFKFFPNPTSGELSVYFTWRDEENALGIQILDLNGRALETCYEGNITAGDHLLQCSLSNLTPGMYFLVLSSNKIEIITHKIIKS